MISDERDSMLLKAKITRAVLERYPRLFNNSRLLTLVEYYTENSTEFDEFEREIKPATRDLRLVWSQK